MTHRDAHPANTFPGHILRAAPVPYTVVDVADYLNHLLDQRPDIHSSALAHADHDDIAGLLLQRHWSRGKVTDMQALADIAMHAECDFWIALAVLLRLYPDAIAPQATIALAKDLVRRMNAGDLPLRYSATPVISPRGLELYALIVEGQPDLAISPEVTEKAIAHAQWLMRKRPADARFAMFNGGPVWAANHGDGE